MRAVFVLTALLVSLTGAAAVVIGTSAATPALLHWFDAHPGPAGAMRMAWVVPLLATVALRRLCVGSRQAPPSQITR